MNYKKVFFDCETTGVKHWQNSIHQLSGCIEIDGQVKEYFNFRVQPYEKAIIDETALAVSHTTPEMLASFMPMKECFTKFVKMLEKYVDRYNNRDKFFLIGYNNAGFDNAFLRAWFVHNNCDFFGSYFWANSIDVMVLASQMMMLSRPKMVDFKQGTVAKYIGIDVDPARLHDAQYDVEILRKLYYRVTIDDLL